MMNSYLHGESTTKTITRSDGTTKPAPEPIKVIDGAASVVASSLSALTGGQSESVALSGTSAQSSAITAGFATVTPTVDCFFRQGVSPTALADGTDQLLLGGNTYRVSGITSGNLLAFITTGATGTVYITPGA